MAADNPLDDLDLPGLPSAGETAQDLEPEVVSGPLGLPLVKPRGLDAPDQFSYDDDTDLPY